MTRHTKIVCLIVAHGAIIALLFAVEMPFASRYQAVLRGGQKTVQTEHRQVRGTPELRVVVRTGSNNCETTLCDRAVSSNDLFEYQIVRQQAAGRWERRLHRWVDNDFWIFFEQLGLVWIGLLACIFMWFYDPAKRKYVVVFVASSIITGLLVEIMKRTTGKIRPEPYFSTYGAYFHVRFLGFLKGWMVNAPVSFPSGHSAQVFVTATFLATLYPRVRWMFYGVAACTAISRVLTNAHWLSDIYLSVLLGYFVTRYGFVVFERVWNRVAPDGVGLPCTHRMDA